MKFCTCRHFRRAGVTVKMPIIILEDRLKPKLGFPSRITGSSG